MRDPLSVDAQMLTKPFLPIAAQATRQEAVSSFTPFPVTRKVFFVARLLAT